MSREKLAATIRQLKKDNIKPNFSALARAYGLDRRTVRKYYESGGIPKRKTRQEYSKWDPYQKIIENKLTIPGMTIRAVYEYFRETLSDDKIPGTYGSLKAYIRKKNFSPPKSANR